MTTTSIRTLLLLITAIAVCDAQIQLTSQQLYDGLQMGQFDVLVDVRRTDEWVQGRIPNATFIENMGSTADTTQLEQMLLGCERTACHIAVYCRSGGRAGQAITRLIDDYDFDPNRLYNGLGVNDWKNANYDLTTDSESVVPVCSKHAYPTTDMTDDAVCSRVTAPGNATMAPTTLSSEGPTQAPDDFNVTSRCAGAGRKLQAGQSRCNPDADSDSNDGSDATRMVTSWLFAVMASFVVLGM